MLAGEPDAGNPHVRFDEGGGALLTFSTLPPLLYCPFVSFVVKMS
jgi:hypothetical protein